MDVALCRSLNAVAVNHVGLAKHLASLELSTTCIICLYHLCSQLLVWLSMYADVSYEKPTEVSPKRKMKFV